MPPRIAVSTLEGCLLVLAYALVLPRYPLNYLHILKYCHYEDIRFGILPSYYGALILRSRDIRRPEDPEQSIGPDHDTIFEKFRKNLVVLIVRVRRYHHP